MSNSLKMAGTKNWSVAIPPYLQVPLKKALDHMDANNGAEALRWFGVCMEAIPQERFAEDGKVVLYFGGQVAAQAYFAVKNRDPQPDQATIDEWGQMAEAILTGACETSPKDPVPRHNLGRLYQDNGDIHRAIAEYQQALMLDPSMVETWGNLGTAFTQIGEDALGAECNDRCVSLPAPLASGKMAQAFIHLRYHRYEEGWKLWWERWNDLTFTGNYGRKDLTKPHWRGEPYRRRDRILVTGEQGLGDQVQFVRYVKTMLEGGYPITAIETRQPLKRWMQRCFPDLDVVVREKEPLPNYTKHCTMMDFPSICGTTVETIPPPIAPLVEAKRLVTDGTKAIGIAWEGAKGNSADYVRSIPRELLQHLRDIPGVTWVNLQFGEALTAKAWLGERVIDGTEGCDDVLDTAAVMAGLDHIFTVDTLTCHLAGSLGVPTTVLHRYCREWRWGDRSVSGDTSHWYPSIRSWDKTEPEDWVPLLKKVRDSIK